MVNYFATKQIVFRRHACYFDNKLENDESSFSTQTLTFQSMFFNTAVGNKLAFQIGPN